MYGDLVDDLLNLVRRCLTRLYELRNVRPPMSTADTGSTCSTGLCVCPARTTECGTRCAALERADTDCGRCGVACGAGQLCVGVCVGPTWTHGVHARVDGGEGRESEALAVATDSAGNLYVTGQSQGDYINFGGGELPSGSLGSRMTDVGFVASFTSSGAYRWAMSLHGGTGVIARAITVSRSGDVVVAGKLLRQGRCR